jgi:hypothetical protein
MRQPGCKQSPPVVLEDSNHQESSPRCSCRSGRTSPVRLPFRFFPASFAGTRKGNCLSPASFFLFLQVETNGVQVLIEALGIGFANRPDFGYDAIIKHVVIPSSCSTGADPLHQFLCSDMGSRQATSSKACGFLAAIISRVRAAPEGARRPCSQSCNVRTETPSS